MKITKHRLAVLAFAVLAACSRSSETPSAPGTLQIQPQTAEIAPGDTVSFGAFLGNARNEEVTWNVLEADGGVVDGNGHYTAPASEGTFHVVAYAGLTETATAVVVVRQRPPSDITVTIHPKAASVDAGATLAFTASVSGTANGAVTWSVQEGAAGGSVTGAGLYAAPPTAGTYHVVARSAQDSSRLDTATVTVVQTVPSGPQLYVSLDGSDSNPGTLAQPWRTIQKAMSSATPGSTVNIRGGTYHERLVLDVSGTADNYITFQPYGFVGKDDCGGYTRVACSGEKVILDYAYLGTNTSTTPLLRISSKQYVIIQGLTMQNFSCNGAMQQAVRVDGTSNHIEWRWMTMNNMRNVYANGPDYTTCLHNFTVWGPANNVNIRNSEIGNIKSNTCEAHSYFDGAHDSVLEKTYFHDTDGIATNSYVGAYNITFRNNRFDYCGLRRDGTKWYGRDSACLYADGGHDIVLEGNYLTNTTVAIESLAEPAAGSVWNVIVRNNIVNQARGTGMVIGTWYSSTDGSSVYNQQVYNNVVYDCGGNAGILVRPFTTASTKIRNNIFAGNCPYSNPLGWNVSGVFDYNLYSGGGSGPDAHKITADPMFANPGAGDFSLLPGSPAIDTGDPTTTFGSAGTVDVLGLPRIVGRVDVGANERQ